MAALQRIACLLLSSKIPEKDLEALAEACGRFSPQIALRSGEAVFIDITASRKLFSEESLPPRLLALARRLVPSSSGAHRVAIAEDAPTALAFARHCLEKKERLPLEALHDFADPFGGDDSDLVKRTSRMIALLRQLGLGVLGDFSILPAADLVSRFGRDALEMSGRVRGEIVSAWPGFHPLPRVIEQARLDEACGESVEALLFVLKTLTDRAMARLRGRCERATIVEITLELEKWSTIAPTSEDGASPSSRKWKIEFPLPQGSAQAVIPILRERLTQGLEREPLTAPMESVSLELLETAPGRGAQRNFFCQKEEAAEALDSLIARLDQKLGKNRAFLAQPVERYLPEKAYERTLPVNGVEGGARALPVKAAIHSARPSRLNEFPEGILVQGGLIIRRDGSRWKTLSWQGPERLSGEWWSEEFHRDYYQVTIETGQRLWVFQDSTRCFYLHGFFD